jgi:putative ABC transport system substrate-binding protein
LRSPPCLASVSLDTASGRRAADGKISRIGALCAITCSDANFIGFRQGLRELGYVESKNLIIEEKSAEGHYDRLPELAAELVRLQVEVILVSGGTEPVLAAKSATRTIPIVIVVAADPVGAGLVASLSRPGGNITGLTSMNEELDAKRLELLKEVIPSLTRVAVFSNPADPNASSLSTVAERTARSLGLQLQLIPVRSGADLAAAFSTATRLGADAGTLLGAPMFFSYQARLAELAAEHRLPLIIPWKQFPEAGGLMSYGANIPDLHRRAAVDVDKILKGVKPGDLPIAQPTEFDFVINLKTAKALGLTIPQSLVVRANEVIQ